MDKPEKRLKIRISQSLVTLMTLLAIIGILFYSSSFAQASSGGGQEDQESVSAAGEGLKYAMVAAAIAFGLGAVGAGIAIAHVGAAAMGAVAEKPQIAGQALIFVALAEGIVVFGFITALMILGKV